MMRRHGMVHLEGWVPQRVMIMVECCWTFVLLHFVITNTLIVSAQTLSPACMHGFTCQRLYTHAGHVLDYIFVKQKFRSSVLVDTMQCSTRPTMNWEIFAFHFLMLLLLIFCFIHKIFSEMKIEAHTLVPVVFSLHKTRRKQIAHYLERCRQ